MLLLYILWDDRPISMISGLNVNSYSRNWNTPWLLQLVNFKKAILTWVHFRRTICNKIMFQTGKNTTETYGMLQNAFRPSFMNRASVFEWHKRFKEGRESVKDDSRCGRRKKVNTPEMIGQRVRVRVSMLSFYGGSGDIPSEEASTLQIGSVAFPSGQYTSPQLHPCHRVFDLDRHQDSSSPSL